MKGNESHTFKEMISLFATGFVANSSMMSRFIFLMISSFNVGILSLHLGNNGCPYNILSMHILQKAILQIERTIMLLK